jgi:phage repressor protein C with HTH and peptisase S24 domain
MQWLQNLLDAARRSQADLAQHLKVAPPRVSEMVRGIRRMQSHEIKPAAEFFGISRGSLQAMLDGDLVVINGVIEQVASRPKSAAASIAPVAANDRGGDDVEYQTAHVTYPSLNAPEDIPLWASASAGDEGAMILVPDPIAYLRRSDRMLNVRNPFAFNVLGDSMSDVIENGDQVIVNPSVVARPGNNCVFIHEGPDGMLALVKRLLKTRPDHWQVRQYNPFKEFDISRRKWARVHPIAEVRKAGVG